VTCKLSLHLTSSWEMANCHSEECFSDIIIQAGLDHEKDPSWKRGKTWSLQTHDLKATGEGQQLPELLDSTQWVLLPSLEAKRSWIFLLVHPYWILLPHLSIGSLACRFCLSSSFYTEHPAHEYTGAPAEEKLFLDSGPFAY
jgi:hypothetical protein